MSRVSVFVDGENISANFALKISKAAQELGEVDLMRVYGDAGLLKGWDETPGFRLIHSGIGKNAADLLLTVDAMERALSGDCDVVVIASSDGDFRHLAERLRERGVTVLGIGQERAGLRFKGSCSKFVALKGSSAAGPKASLGADASPDEPSQPSCASPLRLAGKVGGLPQKIIQAIAQYGGSDAGLEITALQRIMYSEHRVAISCYPEKTWRAYLLARPQLFDVDPRGPAAKVRLRPSAQIAAE